MRRSVSFRRHGPNGPNFDPTKTTNSKRRDYEKNRRKDYSVSAIYNQNSVYKTILMKAFFQPLEQIAFQPERSSKNEPVKLIKSSFTVLITPPLKVARVSTLTRVLVSAISRLLVSCAASFHWEGKIASPIFDRRTSHLLSRNIDRACHSTLSIPFC